MSADVYYWWVDNSMILYDFLDIFTFFFIVLLGCDGLYIVETGSGTFWKCGLVRIGVTLLE